MVLHGHRHTDWMGDCSGVRILSAPSPMMGAADPATPRDFWIHAFVPGPGDALELLASERLVVPGQRPKASP